MADGTYGSNGPAVRRVVEVEHPPGVDPVMHPRQPLVVDSAQEATQPTLTTMPMSGSTDSATDLAATVSIKTFKFSKFEAIKLKNLSVRLTN